MHLHIYCKTCLHSIRSIEIEEKKVNQIENFMSIQSDCKSESGVPSFNRVHNSTFFKKNDGTSEFPEIFYFSILVI